MLFSSINFTKNKHLILVFFLAFCLRLIFLIFFEGLDTKFKEDPLDYYNVAKFAETNGITNWTSHVRPPLLSFIIIPIIKLFPENLELILIKFLMIFLSCITCITIYFLSLQISKNYKVAFISSLSFVFYPFSIFMSCKLLTENLAALLIILLCLSFIKFLRSKEIKLLIICSFLLGLLSLTRSSYYYLPFFMIIIIFFINEAFIKKLYFILSMLVIFFITLSPWILKNYLQLDEFVPTTTRLGVGLWYSNNDFTDPIIQKGGYNKHTLSFKKETEFSRLFDPIKKSEYLKKKSLEEIINNKMLFIKSSIFRFLNFFNPKPNPYKRFVLKDLFMILFYSPFLIIFFIGIFNNNYSINRSFLLLIIFYTLLVHMPFYGIPRFRFPIDSLIFLLSISFLFEDTKFRNLVRFLRLNN